MADLAKVMNAVSALHTSSNNLPVLWCRTLVQTGHTSTLLGLEASVRASIGAPAEKCLRLAEILEDSGKPTGERSEIFEMETYMDKALLGQSIVNMCDLASAAADSDSIFSKEQMERCIKLLAGKVAATAMTIAKEMSEIKTTKLRGALTMLQPLEKAMMESDFEQGATLVKELNEGDEGKLVGPTQGPGLGTTNFEFSLQYYFCESYYHCKLFLRFHSSLYTVHCILVYGIRYGVRYTVYSLRIVIFYNL